MEVSFIEELHCKFEKPFIVGNPEHTQVLLASKATELVEADDDKKLNECKHFTIRGYVAEVRKRDIKNCCPFVLHNFASNESANVFPPLSVTKFRWWGCQNCIHEILTTTDQMTNRRAISMQNEDTKNNNNLLLENATETSQLGLSRSPLISEENHLEVILPINDCSVNTSRDRNEENKCILRNQIEKGLQIRNDCQDDYDDNGNAFREDICVYNGCDAIRKGEKSEYGNSVRGEKLRVACSKDALNPTLVKHKRNKLPMVGHSKLLDGDATSMGTDIASRSPNENQVTERIRMFKKISNDVRNGHSVYLKANMVVGEVDIVDADPARTMCHGDSCQDKPCCRALVDGSKNIGLNDVRPQIVNDVENTHCKKIRKVRLLEDIVRSEKQHMAEDNYTADGDAKIIEHDFTKRRDKSIGKVLLLNHEIPVAPQNASMKSVGGKRKSRNISDEDENHSNAVPVINQRKHYVPQRNQLKSVERKNGYEDLSCDDVGPSLMHWLKNMPKKANAHEGKAHTSYINNKLCISKFSVDLSDRKDLDLDVRDSGVVVHTKKAPLNWKQTSVPKDVRVTSSILIPDEFTSKKFSSKSSKKTILIDKKHFCGMEASDQIGRNAILHSIRNERPLSDRRKLLQIKDSSTVQKKPALQVREILSKNPRNMWTTEQETLDDIPMDIVELLARNQHDRHHLIAEPDANKNLKLSELIESSKCTNGVDHREVNRKNASEAEQGNLSQQNVQVANKGFGVWTTFPSNGDMDHGSKACHCSINGKKNLHIDLNQQYTDSPMSGAWPYSLDTNGNCHQLNLSCCRSNLYSSESCLMDQTTTRENLSRNPHHDDVLLHRNGLSFGVKNHASRNSNSSIPERDLEIFTHSGDYQKSRNIAGKHHLHGFPPTNYEIPNGLSFINLAQSCHSKFNPADLYSNETISALNLLRLMDQAACSNESQNYLQRHTKLIKETGMCVSDQCNGLHESEYESRSKEPYLCPLEVINPSAFLQPKTSCLPFRPLPRIGVLGPALQKEIFNCSNYSRIPNRCSHGFPKTDVKEKYGSSRLIPGNLLWNSHTSLSRCKCLEMIGPDRGSDRHPSNACCSVARDCTSQIGVNNKDDTFLPLRSFCMTEICAVNRNPADFTVIDENNEYMIEIKDLKLKSLPSCESVRAPVHRQKKQRVMKLNDLKCFVIG